MPYASANSVARKSSSCWARALRPTSPAESASSSAAEVRGSVQVRGAARASMRSRDRRRVCRRLYPPSLRAPGRAGPRWPAARSGGHLPTGLRQQDGEVAHTFTVWQMHSGAGVTCPPQRADQGQLGRLHGCCRRPGKSPGACLRSARSVHAVSNLLPFLPCQREQLIGARRRRTKVS